MTPNNSLKYIGDGVYISFDGYHVNIAVNDHTNHVVALDIEVRTELVKYINEIDQTPTNDEDE